MKCKQRDIVLVPFPYTDLSNAKQRPALVISNDEYNKKFKDVLICAITSNRDHIDEYSTTFDDEDMEIAKLPKPSVIKAHKVFLISQDKIIKVYGRVGVGKFEEVEKIVQKLISRIDDKSELVNLAAFA